MTNVANKDCPFCGEHDLLIFPLRYAVLGGENVLKYMFSNTPPEIVASESGPLNDISNALLTKFPETLPSKANNRGLIMGDIYTDADPNIAHNKNWFYTTRPLRSGYVYVLLDRAGKKEWLAYVVTDDAKLANFEPDNPPQNQPVFSCDDPYDRMVAGTIRINKASEVNKAYLIFTPDPVTMNKLDEYANNADAYAEQGKWQTFTPSLWMSGQPQAHTMAATEIPNVVAEVLAKESKAMTQSLNRSQFPPIIGLKADDAQKNNTQKNNAKTNNTQKESVNPNDIDAKSIVGMDIWRPIDKHADYLISMSKFIEVGHPVFVLHDAIGITQELNAWRNEPIADYEVWQQTDYSHSDEVVKAHVHLRHGNISNKHRALVMETMDDVRKGMAFVAQNRATVKSAISRFKKDQEKADTLYKGWIKFANLIGVYTDDEYATIESNRKKRNQQAVQRGLDLIDGGWASKYEKLLNMDYLKMFRKKHEWYTEYAAKGPEMRAQPHLVWLQSNELRAALAIYDKNDVGAGINFANQIGACLVGMTLTKKGKELASKWAQDFDIQDDNLFFKAFCFNQEEIEKAFREAQREIEGPPLVEINKFMQYVQDILGMAENSKSDFLDTALDTASDVAKGALSGLRTFAKTVDIFLKAAEESAKALPPGTRFNKTSMQPFFDDTKGKSLKYLNKWSESSNKVTAIGAITSESILSFGRSGFEHSAAKKLIAFSTASLGRFSLVLKGVDVNARANWKPHLYEWESSGDVFNQIVAMNRFEKKAIEGVRKNDGVRVLDEWNSNNGLGSDYIRIRSQAFITILTSLNLLFAAQNADKSEEGELIFYAAAMATVAAAMEMYAYGFRSFRSSPDTVIAKAASIKYGEIKLVAGGLALAAGGIMSYFSWKAFADAKTAGQNALFLTLALAQTGLTVVSALTSYAETGAFFEYWSVQWAKSNYQIIANTGSKALSGLSRGANYIGTKAVVPILKTSLKSALYSVAASLSRLNIYIFLAFLLYEAYTWTEDDELEEWCRKSCFSLRGFKESSWWESDTGRRKFFNKEGEVGEKDSLIAAASAVMSQWWG
jgi:hypothetical protein